MKMIISSKIPPITCPKNKPKLHFTSSIFFSSSSPQSYNRLSSQSHSSVAAVRSSLKSARSPLVARASSSTAGISENIGDTLCDVSIYTASGEPVMFKDLFDQNQAGKGKGPPSFKRKPSLSPLTLELLSHSIREGMVVVALLRHFGCPCCWELASELKESKATFDSAGVKLIAIGVGTPDKARILAERLPFPMDCLYADPERKAYDVLGLYHGFGRTFFNPASAKVLSRFESLKKAVKKYTIEATPDDRSGVLQQGGMFVFKGNKLLFARKDEGTGDHAPLDDIFDICCRVPVA